MKSKLVLIATTILGLTACDGLGTVDIETTFSKSLTVNVADEAAEGSANFKSTEEMDYPFYETEIIDLTENEDLKDHLDNINEMDIYQVSCKLNGIPEGESIKELTIFSTTAGFSATLYDITENNSSIEMEVSAAVLKALGDQLLQYEELEVGASGTSSYAPMVFTVLISFETKVEASLI